MINAIILQKGKRGQENNYATNLQKNIIYRFDDFSCTDI